MVDHKTEAQRTLDAHGHAIDELHQKLAATPGVDKAKLEQAVHAYKRAHKQFVDDALGCMN